MVLEDLGFFISKRADAIRHFGKYRDDLLE